MICATCEWLKSLEDSEGRTIYYCMNTESRAYGSESGICGECELEEGNTPE